VPERLPSPARITSVARLAATLGLAAALGLVGGLGGCAMSRYASDLGDGGYFGVRGYGVSVALSRDELLARWRVVADGRDAPTERYESLDLNGDGVLEAYETTRFWTPTLRLDRRGADTGSVAPARLELDVRIVGLPDRGKRLDALADALARELLGEAEIERLPFPTVGGFEAVERRRGTSRLVVIDQQPFAHEYGGERRQLVAALLRAASESEALERDFRSFVSAIALLRAAPPLMERERP
jgi:hypothetical protein